MSDARNDLREMVGLLPDKVTVEAAMAALTSSGWDLDDMSFMVPQQSWAAVPAGHHRAGSADRPKPGQGAPVSGMDEPQYRRLLAGMTGVTTGFVVAAILLAVRAIPLVAAVGGAIAAVVSAVLAFTSGWLVDEQSFEIPGPQQSGGGVLLWVAVDRIDDERLAREILRRFGAINVHLVGEASTPA